MLSGSVSFSIRAYAVDSSIDVFVRSNCLGFDLTVSCTFSLIVV
ncbi:hypothetical protein KP509_10G019500 [Ceratopteris richardii]|uniref:Uncharacterized protein n=1 Tax=Ceratopteris richardii TaxID=49495 RepID=A0A8T2U2K3_CERRI|nr:hypothetical protein KP509_10G019500 [Ceratopteris richardii]